MVLGLFVKVFCGCYWNFREKKNEKVIYIVIKVSSFKLFFFF